MQPKATPSQTRGQLERSLAQSIQALYRSKLGHQPSKVTCRLLDQKLIIILEDAAIEPSLKMLIVEQTGVEVIDLLSDTTVETGRVGVIAVLASEPQTKP
jgi:uncharacterized protein YbcI